MTRDEAVAVMAQKLGNRTDLNEVLIAEMQLGQATRLEANGRFQPWFLVTEIATIVATIGEARIALPSNFICELDEGGLWWLDAETNTWKWITKAADDESAALLTGSGYPQAYSVLGDHITLYPTPDEAYTLRMRYAASQTVLSSNVENNWLKYAADLVIADTCEHVAAENMQNSALAAVFAKAKMDAWERLFVAHEGKQHTNRTYSMGGA